MRIMGRLLNRTSLRFLARFVIIILISVFGVLLIGQVNFDENKTASVEAEKVEK